LNIDYVVLHWNRPYFAEANVKLAKMYFPFIRNFILLDDGSRQECVDALKPNFDIVFQNGKNRNEWKKGSVGRLFESFFKQSDADFIIFTEDDFFPCTSYFDDTSTDNTLISPDVLFSKDTCFKDLTNKIEKINTPFFYLQLAKSNYGWKCLETYEYSDDFLRVVPQPEKRIYSNWPWLMGKSVFKKCMHTLGEIPIWQMENIVDKNIKNINRMKPLCVRQKMFIHVGFICTTRRDQFKSIGKFNQNRLNGSSAFSGENQESLDAIRDEYIEKYLNGSAINIEDLFIKGLHYALKGFIAA
jgi:hypothetical protein